MPSFVRLVHSTILDGRFHVYTSPDLQGFNVASATPGGAKREAIAVLDKLAEIEGSEKPDFEFVSEAAALRAA